MAKLDDELSIRFARMKLAQAYARRGNTLAWLLLRTNWRNAEFWLGESLAEEA